MYGVLTLYCIKIILLSVSSGFSHFPRVEQELLTLPSHLTSLPVFSGICDVFCQSLFVCLSFFAWLLCCLSFELRILITFWQSSSCSYICHDIKAKQQGYNDLPTICKISLQMIFLETMLITVLLLQNIFDRKNKITYLPFELIYSCFSSSYK